MPTPNYQYFITRNDQSDAFQLWKFVLDSPNLFTEITGVTGSIPKDAHIIQVGNYLLQWGALNDDGQYPYRLLEFNPSAANPLGSPDATGNWTTRAVKAGTWSKSKYFGARADFANPDGAQKGFESGTDLMLISMHNFVLNWIPTDGRGTYQLFHFDHGSADPLPQAVTPQGAWLTIQAGHQLMYCCGYVIDWNMATNDYWIWQFDAQAENPLSYPAIQQGNWSSIGIKPGDQLVVIGQYLLSRDPSTNKCWVWEFDPKAEYALRGLKHCSLPDGVNGATSFTSIETLIPVDAKQAAKPGTMDFMRSKIKHVIYYMLENRSFDHVCGWLYAKNAPIQIIGPEGPYKGVDKNFKNEFRGKEYAITKYNDGKLSEKTKDGQDFVLDLDQQDPYHDCSDVLRQLFYKNINDYYSKKTPDMGGFAWNNGTEEVMLGYSPEQLPVLNGLAKHFAISDEWYCSIPSGTDANRAMALTGSTLGKLNNFQNGAEYLEWADQPHRPSIWKILWSNGIEDFKIYNAVEWINCRFTYNLFLKGQIPSIDGPFVVGNYATQLNQFFDDLKYGTLPKFSFLEPKWVASLGSTSYHPGNDLIPGERQLNDIFNAMQDSPSWEDTLLVITFDEHGGLADHVPPPYAVNPYANDSLQGFTFDLLGPRIPTILVSPWIKENTVFRSETGTAYDSTSILATMLHWLGIPKSRWGLGERTNQAPTFEAVIREKKARKARINLPVPWDSKFPQQGDGAPTVNGHLPIHDLHRLVVPRMVADLTPNLTSAERMQLADQILNDSKNLAHLHEMLSNVHRKHGA